MRNALALALALSPLLAASPARASCGAANCPIDSNAFNQPSPGGWAVDLSFQYIDQDRPRIGTRTAGVGELPSDHDEVRTINRAATLVVGYAWSPSLRLGLTVPYVSRFHQHIAHEEDGVAVDRVERWRLAALGDVALQAQQRLWVNGRTALWGSLTAKLPTGPDDLRDGEAQVAELPIQPGTGSVDLTAALALRGSALREARRGSAMGHTNAVPWFASLSYRRNGRGREGYRIGDEWQASVGVAYPLSQRVDGLLQLNGRHRAEDATGTSGEEPQLTGGKYLFLSPGLRLALSRWAIYGYLQLPLYQDVNGEQLTAARNWLFGVQTAF